MANFGYGVSYSGYGAAAPLSKQTGSPNTKSIGASGRKFSNVLNPWGSRNVPKNLFPKNWSATGSSMKKPIQDPSETGMDYPPGDPLYWPVIPNWDGSYTRQPSVSGLSGPVITWWNQVVEHAYTRAAYQTTP